MVLHRAHILLNGGALQRMSRKRTDTGRAWRFAAALAAVALAGAAPAEETQWRDIESRIQYAYYTEDGRTLRNLQEAVAAEESHEPWRGYYQGLAAWRLAQLATQNPGSAGGPSAAELSARCVHELGGVLETKSDFAEGLALRSACESMPLAAGGMHVPFAAYRPRKDLDRALQLAAKNPRVLLIDAVNDYQLPSAQGGNKERALTKLRNAVAAFETERGGPEPLPGWGAAEAYFFLGRDLMDHGDAVGARDALEHALLLAPQYAQARRLMAKITSG
jgi:hypothetical protein